jgi:hypothetical protein
VVAITMPTIPAATVLPGDLCTATNGNCYNSTYLPPTLQAISRFQPSWTAAFVGQTKCASYFVCITIDWDGSLIFSNSINNIAYHRMSTPVGLSGISFESGTSSGYVTTFAEPDISNQLVRDGSFPTSWKVRSTFRSFDANQS